VALAAVVLDAVASLEAEILRHAVETADDVVDSPTRVLMLSSMIGPDIIEYLDTGKVFATSAAGEPIMLAQPVPTFEYWEGEE